ncbi:UNVERIFIED_CONTAM: hypothetical protein PYX00_003711 [Menopon gallinae]|uniref:C2H2-type domain-containing protein n=1 Tax=Menopon gallinae TaxID=328185 RepID=A0AAW2I2Z9_9NEOP
MSNQEMTNENLCGEGKQLIGSSKRKRKSSIIKHNVVSSDKPQSNDTEGTQKPVRTYVKKVKSERRSVKDKSVNEVNESANESMKDDQKEPVDGIETSETVDLNAKDESGLNLERDEGELKQMEKTTTETEDGQCMGKQQQCQNCNFCAEHKVSNLESDAKVDYVSKTFTCKVCSGMGLKRVYSSMEKLKRHTKEVHEPKKDVKRFECTDCPEPVWFPTKSKFCYHLGAKHPGVIKFVCEVCTQTFKLKANYKNHLKTHNIVVQKKFSCDVCLGTFVNRAGYEAHKKRFPGQHIKQSCVRCGVSFSKEKHMKNHRCKILLLEEAAAAARDSTKGMEAEKGEKLPEEGTAKQDIQAVLDDKKVKEGTLETDAEGKKQGAEGDQSGKRVLFQRLLPKKNEKLIYKQFPLQTQNVPQSVVVQEFREIDLEGGAFITAEPDHQIIVRDVNGHLVQGNQILQLDINDFQPGEESQVYLADWNVVAPFVIRGKSP